MSAEHNLLPLLCRLWSHLPGKRRVQLAAVAATTLASGLAEVASLAAVTPFLTVLVAPDRLWHEPWIRRWAASLGLTQPADLLLPATMLFACAALVSGAIRLFNLWLSGRVAAGTGSDLAQEAYRRTLHQPYAVHVARNSATIITALLSHVDGLVYGVLNPLLAVAVNVAVVVAVAVGLVVIDPGVACLAVLGFGGMYLAISAATRRSLTSNSHEQARCSRAIVQTVQEGLGGIRDVLLDHSQAASVARYRDADWALRQLRARAELLGGFPRFVIEAVGMSGVAALAYVLVGRPGGIAAALPVLGSLALGAQRLLPALQQTYVSFMLMQTHTAPLQTVLDLLDQPAPDCDRPRPTPAVFSGSIVLDRVSFRYQPDGPFILRDVSVEIRRGERVALVGPTGSGKSTLADILMGLLPPTAGRLLIDGRPVASAAWQANIAHVPQAIFLADASIEENIALGIPPADVDRARLAAAARQAQVADFIESLPNGYQTPVGERGVRLSGGQRQRIGIARALYRQCPVLVLDEATSALDDATEQALLDTLAGLSRELTIVMIAHRLSTTAFCDRVLTVVGAALAEAARSVTTA